MVTWPEIIIYQFFSHLKRWEYFLKIRHKESVNIVPVINVTRTFIGSHSPVTETLICWRNPCDLEQNFQMVAAKLVVQCCGTQYWFIKPPLPPIIHSELPKSICLCIEETAPCLSHSSNLCINMSFFFHPLSNLVLLLGQKPKSFLFLNLDRPSSRLDYIFTEAQLIINCLYSRQIVEETKIQVCHCRVLEG